MYVALVTMLLLVQLKFTRFSRHRTQNGITYLVTKIIYDFIH